MSYWKIDPKDPFIIRTMEGSFVCSMNAAGLFPAAWTPERQRYAKRLARSTVQKHNIAQREIDRQQARRAKQESQFFDRRP